MAEAVARGVRFPLAALAVWAWFAGICAFLSWQALQDLRADMESLSWPRAQGQVVRLSHARAPLDDRQWGCPYEVYLQYEYVAGSATLSSRRITRSRDFVCANDSDLDAMLLRFRVGNGVTVSYRPGSPEFAILEPRVQTTDYLGLALFPLSLALPAYLYWRGRKRAAGVPKQA